MAAKSKSQKKQKTAGSAGKTKNANDHDYPNIIEEPIRVVGDQTRGKRAGKSGKQSARKSG